jgi:hypothetical protein
LISVKKNWPVLLTMSLVILTALLVYYKDSGVLDYSKLELNKTITEKTFDNYAEKVIEVSRIHNVKPEYMLALIALECSGRKIVPHRFEAHIYKKLDLVARGKTKKMENVSISQIKGLSEATMRELSSSWGPFQIMGYKSFDIGVDVADLRGKKSVELGAKWIAESYGYLLIKEDFKSAFHMHNAGSKYPKFGPPKTYHKDYVPRGLKYMDEFRRMLDEG